MNTTRHTRFSFTVIAALVLIASLSLVNCGGGGGGDGIIPTYTVTYDGNGNTGGSVPIDANAYAAGQTVTVLGNTNSLAKTGCSFGGWNTQADGNGTTYGATFTMGAAKVTLYAKWTANPTYTVTYDVNTADSGSVPVDSNNYEQGQPVTVPGNPGALVKASNFFIGWNTASTGTGTAYTQAQTFLMGSVNVILYAKWTTNPAYTVTYDGNGNTGGIVPVNTTNYEPGQTVMVFENTGSLVNAGYVFAGWNTLADGSGTSYGASFSMGSANVTLYAKWEIFTDNHDGTMTDNRTGLMWIQSPDSTTRLWQPAMDYCDTLDFAGHTDWRLPSKDELIGVIQGWKGTTRAEWLTSQGFSNVQIANYWSSTALSDTVARFVYMGGNVDGYHSKTASSDNVWPVRTGP